MNKDKWEEIAEEANEKANDRICDVVNANDVADIENGPKDWPEIREAILEYIKEVDKATEVYNMENNIKGESNGK